MNKVERIEQERALEEVRVREAATADRSERAIAAMNRLAAAFEVYAAAAQEIAASTRVKTA